MISAGLSIADQILLAGALVSDHHVRVIVNMLNLNESVIAPLSSYLYDGQVTISADAKITRAASIVLLDPERILTIDADSPADGALYYDKMISLTYCVWKIGWTRSIDIPIFRGPIIHMKRTGMFISIDAFGKEILAQNAIWTPRSYKKGSNKTLVIRDLMRNGTGESKFSMQNTSRKLPSTMALVRESIPWDYAKKIAAGMSMQLFYDGRGTLRLRSFPTATAWTFRDGTGGSILTQPDINYDMDNVRNLILVKGGKPKGSKIAVEGKAFTPPSHPLNHNRIGRNGVKRVLLEVIEDSTITSKSEADAKALNDLNHRLLQGLDIQANTLPIVHLEENDLAAINMSGQYALRFRLKEMTIPLVGGTSATVGTRRMLAIKRRK